jgi:hypothetical protein
MRKLFIFTCLLSLLSCNNQHRTKGADISGEDKINIDTTSYITECESVEDTTYRETLNEIRFAGWTRKEWADNEYIREVRRYIDAYLKGDVENPDLYAHKGYMQGKFIIADISPCLLGGAFIYFSFYDYPDKVFAAMVYSDVDEKTRVVSNYECRSLTYEDLDLNITQEEIRQFLKESHEQKMW